MYIIRTAFWLSVVILLLPADPNVEENSAEQAQNEQVSATQTLGAALSAAGDIAGLCARQPEVCETGSAAWQTFQSKARYGVELLYDWASGSDPAKDPENNLEGVQTNARLDAHALQSIVVADNTAPVHTGSTDTQRNAPAGGKKNPKSQNTLKIEDLIPRWIGPGESTRA